MSVTIASLFVFAITFFALPATAQAAPAMQRTVIRQSAVNPKPAPKTRTFVAIPFPSPQPSHIGNVVFVPSGTAYFTDATSEIASFSPSGVYTRIPVPHAVVSYTLLYARGVFWMVADQGIVKVAPDGSSRRWLPLTIPGTVTYVETLAAGPDGDIYALAMQYPKTGGAQTGVLFRIGITGSITSMPLSVMPAGNGAEAFGADKLLYFGYTDAAGTSGIARLENDGSLTFFPIAGSYQTTSFVLSKGNIYFNNVYYNNSISNLDGQLGRITPAGVVTIAAFPATGRSTEPSALSVDRGGNLWVVVDDLFGINQYFLYQYNIYTGHFNGPYLTGLPNIFYNGPVVAPDDNVWIVLPGTSNTNYFEPIGIGIFANGT